MAHRPVTILGGYLGAGKTTLVNHVLRHAAGRRIAVLVNDFGTLPIDVDLIERAEGGILSLAGGCVCCSYGDDLMQAMLDLAKSDPAPDHVLIETSGVALPGAVARSLSLLFDYRLDAIVVLADVETTVERLADRYMGDTLARQFRDADLIVVNKCDLVSGSLAAAVVARLASDFAQARIIKATRGAIAVDVVLGFDTAGAPRQRRHAQAAAATSTHDQVSLIVEGAIDTEQLASLLPSLALVRVKGILRDRAGAWRVIQLAGRRVTLDAAPDGTKGPASFVGIAVGAPVDRAAVIVAIEACGGTVRQP